MKTTSRRRFGKWLAALTAATTPAAAAQQKPEQPQAEATEEQAPPPCSVNPALAEYDIPRGTEPSFTFRA